MSLRVNTVQDWLLVNFLWFTHPLNYKSKFCLGVFGGNVSLSCPFLPSLDQGGGTHTSAEDQWSSSSGHWSSSAGSFGGQKRANLVMWFHNSDTDPFYRFLFVNFFFSAIQNDVILAYHWLIKMYTGLPLVI